MTASSNWQQDFNAIADRSPESLLHFLDETLRQQDYLDDLEAQIEIRLRKAKILRDSAAYEQALAELTAADIVAKKALRSDLQAKIILTRGTVKGEMGQVPDAIDDFHAARKLANAEDNKDLELNILNALGVAYLYARNPERAIEYLKQTQSLAQQLGNKERELVALGNIGTALADMNETEASLKAHRQAYALTQALATEQDLNPQSVYQLANICSRLFDLNRLDQAELECNQALEPAEAMGHVRILSGILMTLGKIKFQQGQEAQAMPLLERALSLVGTSTPTISLPLIETLASVYSNLDKSKQAATYWKQAIELQRSLEQRERAALTEELEVRYEVERRDRDIELLQLNAQLREAELKNRDRQLFFAGGLLIASVLLMAALWRGYTDKRKLEAELLSRNSKLEDALNTIQKLASVDSLTGLLNRRAFHDIARQALEHKRRTDTPISLALGDVDKFKQINDSYGHAVGDEVLTEIASRLTNSLRGTDVVVRWGGEEFLCFFPTTDIKAAMALAEKLRLAVNAYPVSTAFGEFNVSITFGLAQVDDDVQDAIRRADKALYDGKHMGGNVCRLEDAPTEKQ
ncbi:two-component response regulator protein [Aequoribacter fuscus]|uniref:diguanylate cyclase n=1 Tax=Aequoribacter fuscus TaxID=2518989 RepID=F3L2X8_9GAMM|nr:diguanylate cyclase [Aequoribacter fuscus]EGG29329.1 two-component response regulator protein [Aequoribacter fuscus]